MNSQHNNGLIQFYTIHNILFVLYLKICSALLKWNSWCGKPWKFLELSFETEPLSIHKISSIIVMTVQGRKPGEGPPFSSQIKFFTVLLGRRVTKSCKVSDQKLFKMWWNLFNYVSVFSYCAVLSLKKIVMKSLKHMHVLTYARFEVQTQLNTKIWNTVLPFLSKNLHNMNTFCDWFSETIVMRVYDSFFGNYISIVLLSFILLSG